MSSCELTGSCCSSLAAALQSETCRLTELDLSINDLDQSGAMQIFEALKAPTCTLEKLEYVCKWAVFNNIVDDWFDHVGSAESWGMLGYDING